jgi:hypothetical protein
MVEPLLARGRLTLNAEVTAERKSRVEKRNGLSNVARGANVTNTPAPTVMTRLT